MSTTKRLSILMKYTNFIAFFFIAVFYGVLFGGILDIGDIINSKKPLTQFILSAVASGGAYFVFFGIAMVAIFVLTNTKLYISMSMPNELVKRLWHDLIIGLSLLDTTIIFGIIMLAKTESQYTVRLFNLDISHLSLTSGLLLFLISWFVCQLLIQLATLISNIGNHFGIFSAFGTLGFVIAVLLFFIKGFVDTLIWGNYLIPTMITFALVTIGLYLINARMLSKIEVSR